MKTSRRIALLFGALSTLIPLSAAASGERDCRLRAVLLRQEVAGAEVVLHVRVRTSTFSGHSVRADSCPVVGSEMEFSVDNDRETLAASLRPGDLVELDDRLVFTRSASSRGAFYTHMFLRRVASARR